MIKNVIFPLYGVPRILISDGGTHFTGNSFRKGLSKLGIEHRVATPYHPQTNDQAETLNRQLKSIFNKTIEKGGKDWSKKLDGELWAYWTAQKTQIGMTPYQFVYGKSCHLPLELEHKEYWAIKEMNLDVDAMRIKRRIQIRELEEMRLKAYESATIYKERMKRWYDKRLQPKEFK
jgi:transposase InsO family protein